MVGERLHVNERVANTKRTVSTQVQILRNVLDDVRERIDADGTTEPPNTHGLGGSLGQRGSLIKEPIAVLVRTVDNVAEHVQGFARINRAMIRR